MPQDLPSEACVRRIVVPAFRRAVVDLFGPQGRDRMVALLEGDAREHFVRDVGAESKWFPARHLIAWGFAAWEGPAERKRELMSSLVRRQWDLSFGIVRRMLLHLAAPAPIVGRLGKLWEQDNIGGTMTASLDADERGATIYLSDSPFVDTPHGRASIAEVYRHAFSQTRARDVAEAHALDGGRRMVIRLKWTM